ncbi:hypothetical protein PoB_006226500 [Plakobranchus ocellatus]|uniref:Uncharacterized protein n=1 Tax=Plakobranchus ocellatus TaxID=259542 RepID=A0AAV4CV60_9GAST|nr:hypothetical protein PoB_006226500 [Plakobranchus ocellatus]
MEKLSVWSKPFCFGRGLRVNAPLSIILPTAPETLTSVRRIRSEKANRWRTIGLGMCPAILSEARHIKHKRWAIMGANGDRWWLLRLCWEVAGTQIGLTGMKGCLERHRMNNFWS